MYRNWNLILQLEKGQQLRDTLSTTTDAEELNGLRARYPDYFTDKPMWPRSHVQATMKAWGVESTLQADEYLEEHLLIPLVQISDSDWNGHVVTIPSAELNALLERFDPFRPLFLEESPPLITLEDGRSFFVLTCLEEQISTLPA